MGQVYGRMSLASASSRSPSGDHHTGCPSKAKPDYRGAKMGSSSASAGGRNLGRRSLSSSDNQEDSGDDQSETGNQLNGVRLTRQAARQMAQQQAAQQAATIRRSVRLALISRVPTSGGGSRLVNYRRSINLTGAGAASLPTTLRRSARIAGFRYIGHRVAADFSSSTSSSAAAALVRRRKQSSAMGGGGSSGASNWAANSAAHAGVVRRSERLLRA